MARSGALGLLIPLRINAGTLSATSAGGSLALVVNFFLQFRNQFPIRPASTLSILIQNVTNNGSIVATARIRKLRCFRNITNTSGLLHYAQHGGIIPRLRVTQRSRLHRRHRPSSSSPATLSTMHRRHLHRPLTIRAATSPTTPPQYPIRNIHSLITVSTLIQTAPSAPPPAAPSLRWRSPATPSSPQVRSPRSPSPKRRRHASNRDRSCWLLTSSRIR